MTIDPATLPYRPCVGVMLVNMQGLVFVGKRIDIKEGDTWQMPQGGIDDGEEPVPAALRELEEETGVSRSLVTIIGQTPQELFYDLPDHLIGKLWKGKYRGQRQHWLLLRFTGVDEDIRLDAHQPAEFSDFRWVEPDQLPDLIVPFKRGVYTQVLETFRDLI